MKTIVIIIPDKEPFIALLFIALYKGDNISNVNLTYFCIINYQV